MGYDFISAEFSYGTHRTDPDADEYWFLSGTVEQWGLFATFGMFGDDADGANHDGEYYEAGYGTSVGDFDVTASWIYSTDTILAAAADDHSSFSASVIRSISISTDARLFVTLAGAALIP